MQSSGPLLAKPSDNLSYEALKLGVRKNIAVKFDRWLSSTAAKLSVKFQSNWTSPDPNLTASTLHKILW